jgi:hypothetical protein
VRRDFIKFPLARNKPLNLFAILDGYFIKCNLPYKPRSPDKSTTMLFQESFLQAYSTIDGDILNNDTYN